MTQPLGNITDIDSANAREWRDLSVKRRYQLQDAARELLPEHRVSGCLRNSLPNRNLEVWLDTQTERAHLKGVMCCGSVWVCPVCASKVAIGRRDEVQEALKRAKTRGWQTAFVTLTSRHERQHALSDSLKRSKAALRFMRASRQWGYLRAAYGLEGSIDAVETTWGFNAGWHVHFHMIFFFSGAVDLVKAEATIFDLWNHALDGQGMECDREHGVQVVGGFEKAAEYITKWALQTEVTSREKPGREGHFGPFQLLDLYEQGEDWAGKLFQEYADATKGLSSMRWSRGLRQKLEMPTEASDQELAEASTSEQSVKLVTLTPSDVKKLLYSGRRGVLGEVVIVAERGQQALLLWLKSVFDIQPLPT